VATPPPPPPPPTFRRLADLTPDLLAKSEAQKRRGAAFEQEDVGGWVGITDKYWLAALMPAAPDQPTRICDINKTAVYELGPEGLRLDLTNVDSFLNPLTGVQLVQMTMTAESSKQFAEFTATRVGQQVAFVRGTTVVWGPKIGAPIDGQVLQLSGDLTAEQAEEIAKMLGEKR
jgi:hypothetical protein